MAKIENQGQFWNPQDKQISKVTLFFEFGEDLMELLPKNKLGTFFVDTLYIGQKPPNKFYSIGIWRVQKYSNYNDVKLQITTYVKV